MSLVRTVTVRSGLWLVFGLVASLLIACGCALAGRGEPSRASHSAPLNDGADDWSGSYGLAFGIEHFELFRLDDWMTPPPLEPGQTGPRRLPDWACVGLADDNVRQASRFASGWPFRCAVAGIDNVYDERTARRRWEGWGLVKLGQTRRTRIGDTDLAFDDKLPVRPIWRGLALNTLILAAGAYSMLRLMGVSARAIRRIWIRKEGHCRSCGYDLLRVPRDDGEARCPECGALVEDK